MKRILIPGLMLAAAFALTNCSEQLVPPVQEGDSIVEETVEASQIEEVPFEVFAQSEEVETKTSATGSKGYLKWEAGDALNVFHSQAGKNSYSKHGQFIVDTNNEDGAKKGLFIGNLNLGGAKDVKLYDKNDWFFLYPYSRDDTPTVTNNVVTLGKVTIGSAAGGVQYQKAANSKEHIAGENYPMYGKVQNLAKSKNPAANMKHLSALVAVKVVNEGHGGDITIEDVAFEAKEDIVGDFTLKMPASGGHTFTGQGTAEAKKAKVAFSDPETNFSSVTIAKNESTTLYLAVKPFTVKSGASLTIRVNGSARTVKMSKDVTFEAGKVTTIKVPVKDYVYDADNNPTGHPYTSDALDITSKGNLASDTDQKIINIGGKQTMTINGKENIDVYVVGEEGKSGTITIQGFAKEMVNALPVGFYASQWNSQPTAMTIKTINAYIPEYKTSGGFFGIGATTHYSQVKERKSLSEGYGTLAGTLGWDLSNGITRDLIVNTLGIAAQTITFNGMVANGGFDNKNVVILDENPVYKEVSNEKVEEYLKRFGADATLQGLKDILNGEMKDDKVDWTDEAKKTGQAIYNKVKGVIAGKVGDSLAGIAMGIVGFSSYEVLMYKFRDMKFELVIETYPYAAKYTTETPTTTLQPIVFWGFDAYGVDE